MNYYQDFFVELKRIASNKSVYERIIEHIDYLAKKSSMTEQDIFNGAEINIDPIYIIDCIDNINAILAAQGIPEQRHKESGLLYNTLSLIDRGINELEGWCSEEKGHLIAKFILSKKLYRGVEIGIYGGRSIVPAAAALRELGKGEIYGIEAWNPQVAITNKTSELNDEWWANLNFYPIKESFF